MKNGGKEGPPEVHRFRRNRERRLFSLLRKKHPEQNNVARISKTKSKEAL